jgi:L-ascorbate metabolism protein UlaG (beta-lactamase superfamily)
MLGVGHSISVQSLGQAGFRFGFATETVYIDPYLSHYVEEVEGAQAQRLVPVAMDPAKVTDASWVLVTHEHLDHCDPQTLGPIAEASPECRLMGPSSVRMVLADLGVEADRLEPARADWTSLSVELRVRSVPAAHPELEIDADGHWSRVGYLFDYRGRKIYHSGDTSVCPELIEDLQREGGIDVAFVSVNERNYYRESAGIIGNMSVRDAFRFAEDIGVRTFVPMHWDMFAPNLVFIEEIELLYRKIRPNLQLTLLPREI